MTERVSVAVTIFSRRYPTGTARVYVASVISYGDFRRLLHGSMLLTIILPPDFSGVAPLPADVFHTVVAALTAAVVAEVRARHSLGAGSPRHDVTMTERAGR